MALQGTSTVLISVLKDLLREFKDLRTVLQYELAFRRVINANWTRAAVTGTASETAIYTNASSIPLAVSVLASDLGEAGQATWFQISATRQLGAPTHSWRMHAEDRRLDLILKPGESLYNAGSNGNATIFIGSSLPFDPVNRL